MLSLEESLKILKETKALIEGHFILSSGLHSSKYVQCAQLMSKCVLRIACHDCSLWNRTEFIFGAGCCMHVCL